MSLLEMQGIRKVYQTARCKITAVDGVSLSLEKGDFCCILGKSGSGKSTLLNLCTGILSLTEGTILLDGKNLGIMSDEALSFLRNDTIGYVMQGYALLPNLTVRANIQLPRNIYPRDSGDLEQYMDELLKMMGLDDKADRYPAELSGGEIRRVEIARALINRPQLLVADEPTGELDKINSQRIMELFRTINDNGTTILMVTHDLDATAYCKQLYTMENGMLTIGDAISSQLTIGSGI